MRARAGLVLSIVLLLASGSGCSWWGDESGPIRARLQALRDEVNSAPPPGIGAAARAARIAGYFTEDASVELGEGTAPISGREMLIGVIGRLATRTSEYTLDLADISVQLAPDGRSADVGLTAEFISRAPTERRSRDAREFRVTMRREDEWRIARVVAVQTLR